MYMVIVFLLCVNVLIAVVSDSYDYAMFRAHKIFMRTKLQTFAEFDALGLLTMPFAGNGFLMDRLVVPCLILVFVNPVMAIVTLKFWGIVAYSPTADEAEHDEWRGAAAGPSSLPLP